LREYETTFIVQPEISDESCSEICGRLDSIVEKHGGRHVMLDDWGKRKLAFEIAKFQKGHYFVLYYLDDGKAVPEIERLLRLDESVLRFLTVKAADRVADPDARVALGLEQERIQKEKAAERAARDAEAAREAEARAAASEAAAAKEAEAAKEEAAAKEAAAAAEEAEAATKEAAGGEEAGQADAGTSPEASAEGDSPDDGEKKEQ
jgi:small subunit ribosomal protein S6